MPRRVLDVYRRRAVVEEPYELRRHPASLRLTLSAAFGVLRMQEITDTLVDLLLVAGDRPSPQSGTQGVALYLNCVRAFKSWITWERSLPFPRRREDPARTRAEKLLLESTRAFQRVSNI